MELIRTGLAVVGVGMLVPAGVCVLWWWFRLRPSAFAGAPSDTMILAAHPDDCVIMAGEWTVDAVAAGREVHVVYLTCGDSSQGTDRTRRRRAESEAVWMSVGVPATRLHWIDAPQSPVEGPSLLNDQQRRTAVGRIAGLLGSLPRGASVLIPAEGEHHVDHRELRALALESMRIVGRADLQVLEAPEYSPFHSFLRNPGKTIRYVLETLPLTGSIARSMAPPTEGFVRGPGGFVLSPVRFRLETKLRMLRGFVSEDGAKLVWHFGRPDLFRPLSPHAGAGEKPLPWTLRVRWRRLSFEVALAWCGLGLLMCAGAMSLGTAACAALGRPTWAISSVAAFGVLTGLLALRGRRPTESQAMYVATGVGFVLSAAAEGWAR